MPKFCPTCGKKLPFEDADICPGCGVRIEAPPTKKTSQTGGQNFLTIILIIGVILVVVVILSAIVAAFVYGMAGSVQSTKTVAVTAAQQGNNIVITYLGGQDANMVSELQYGIGTANRQWNSPKVGDHITLSGGTSGEDHVIVLATFTDGVKQVILDKYV